MHGTQASMKSERSRLQASNFDRLHYTKEHKPHKASGWSTKKTIFRYESAHLRKHCCSDRLSSTENMYELKQVIKRR